MRRTVEARGENYLTFPQRALFDRIGARNFVLETDIYGNFIMTGYDFGSALDWTRFGLLHSAQTSGLASRNSPVTSNSTERPFPSSGAPWARASPSRARRWGRPEAPPASPAARPSPQHGRGIS